MKQEHDCKREIRHMRFYRRILNVEETRFDSAMEEISYGQTGWEWFQRY